MAIRVAELHTAKGRRLPMRAHESVEVETQQGIVGDRYHGSKHRQVTVQSRSQLDEAAVLHGGPVPSGLTRRNITLDVAVVPTSPGDRIVVGGEAGVVLEVVRVAAPCKLLDDTIGPGAQHAMRWGKGGAVCRVLQGGPVQVGDEVRLVPRAEVPAAAAAG
jgi:MOSC domain-containing protein YiiM